MRTFIKVMLKKLNGQTNVNKFRVTAHEIFSNIMSKQNLDFYVINNLKDKLSAIPQGRTDPNYKKSLTGLQLGQNTINNL